MEQSKIDILKGWNVSENIISACNEEQFSMLYNWCLASKAYYDTEEDDDPIMSDAEFDELQNDIINTCPEVVCDFVKSCIYRNGKFDVKHYTQEMISLFKIKWKSLATLNEITAFFKQTKNTANQLFYSPKFDGCSLKITWNHHNDISEIVSIITRGGIDCTEVFSYLPSIQATAKYGTEIVCGELLCKKEIFNKKYSSESGGTYENSRNFVGGLVKRSKIENSILNDLSFIPCTDGINMLNTIWKPVQQDTLKNLESIISKFKSEEFPYLCDGIVLAFDEPTHEREVKDNYPLNMVAVKFPAPRAETTVIGFDWTQKKSGKLTPRLILEPVKLDGSTITYANGYNIERVTENGIGIGSIVEIEKSGDIIPVVVKVKRRSIKIEYPSCEFKHIGKHLIAVDKEKSKVFKFVAGLNLLQIQGIGDTYAEQIGKLVDYDIIELFNQVHKPDICELLGNGAIWKNFTEFYNIKQLHLDELINVLQFDNVGPKIAKKVALLLLKESNDTSNMSSDVISNVCRGEGFKLIGDSIKKLRSLGITILKPVEINENTITFEMSGAPAGMSKSEFESKFKKICPNATHTTLNKSTKLLIVDNMNSNSSKTLKARKYNIKIITYQDALNGKI